MNTSPPTVDPTSELLTFFKALSDGSRLKIVGLLARESYTVEQLAAILDLRAATVSHHLSRLSEAGLVSVRTEGYYHVYSLQADAIRQMAERLLSRDLLPQTAASLDRRAFDEKVVADFSRRDGSLKEIPAQQKKLLAVLRHIVKEFQPGRKYTEAQVNEIMGRFHPDTASLRREMIGFKLMQGTDGKGWRIDEA